VEEIDTLINYLGGIDKAGGEMKSTIDLKDNNTANNFSRFTGLPGVYCAASNNFWCTAIQGFWWLTTETWTDNAETFILNFDDPKIHRGYHYKSDGLSVRCLKD
jgi:uncharacterized protein (TIGR02145 family)